MRGANCTRTFLGVIALLCMPSWVGSGLYVATLCYLVAELSGGGGGRLKSTRLPSESSLLTLPACSAFLVFEASCLKPRLEGGSGSGELDKTSSGAENNFGGELGIVSASAAMCSATGSRSEESASRGRRA